MKIILFSRPGSNICISEFQELLNTIIECGFDYIINNNFATWINQEVEGMIAESSVYTALSEEDVYDAVMISYGGDGTLLEAVRVIGELSLPILGINSGHLGFLANVQKKDIKKTFLALKAGEYEIEKRAMINVEGDFDTPLEFPCAFNEFSIQRHHLGLIELEIDIDGERVVTYRSDGAIIATPTGSTAYSLSAGGPIVAPQSNCFIISPIAPHNLTMRPIVVPDNSIVQFKVFSREEYAFAGLDNENFIVKNGATFQISKAKKSVLLIKLRNISFYDTLRNKMMWGLDGRDSVK